MKKTFWNHEINTIDSIPYELKDSNNEDIWSFYKCELKKTFYKYKIKIKYKRDVFFTHN